jgi:hypothetical protein
MIATDRRLRRVDPRKVEAARVGNINGWHLPAAVKGHSFALDALDGASKRLRPNAAWRIPDGGFRVCVSLAS